ncbi:MAG TPA: DNA polymerase IV [Gammaproteobacteria bacterium]|nr:DNA polymerase IV [Gammaproteobacteria bacterium]
MNNRLIAHVDMDAFYASVEQHDDPKLKGQAVIVGGSSRRSVVCAASYEARVFGVHSAMPMYEARRRCPDGMYLPVRMARYREISAAVFACFTEFAALIEGLSLDEAFLDLSDASKVHDALAIGSNIKRRIRADTGLTASVGLGPNKLIAKIASERCKPDGLLHIPVERVRETLDPLPVTALWGIGPRTGEQLAHNDIRTIQDLRLAPQQLVQALFGNQSHFFQSLAAGHDERTVGLNAGERSVSQETTFENDLTDLQTLAHELGPLTEGLCAILRRDDLLPNTLVLKLRTADFRRHTRQRRFAPPDNSFAVLWPLAKSLLREWLRKNPGQALRLIGIGARDFATHDQLALFEDSLNRNHRLDSTTEAIQVRFGERALHRGMP